MEFKLRSCPICGSTDTSKVYVQSQFNESKINEFSFSSRKDPEYTHYKMVICPTCDLLYAPKIPTTEYLKTAYEEARYDSCEESEFASRTYLSYLVPRIAGMSDRRNALDIGAGNGDFLKKLRSIGFQNLVGVEASRAPIEAADEDVQNFIRFGLFDPEDFEPLSFNLISCTQTLEHLEDPKVFCSDAFKLLRNGGAFFVISHDYRSYLARILKTRSPIFDIEHFQINSPKSLKIMMERVGFVNVSVNSIVNRYPIRYWLRLAPLNQTVKKIVLAILYRSGLSHLPVPMLAGNMVAIGFKLVVSMVVVIFYEP